MSSTSAARRPAWRILCCSSGVLMVTAMGFDGVRCPAGGPKPLPALRFKGVIWYKARPFLAITRRVRSHEGIPGDSKTHTYASTCRGVPGPTGSRLRHGAYGGLTPGILLLAQGVSH